MVRKEANKRKNDKQTDRLTLGLVCLSVRHYGLSNGLCVVECLLSF
jgi:hypothetical protein